jgi:hypothetical protein
MHCCGNPLHDIPGLLAVAFPFLGTGLWWLRSKFRPKRQPCTAPCAHDHKKDGGE